MDDIKPFSADISVGNEAEHTEPITPTEHTTPAEQEEPGAFGEIYPTVREWNKKVWEVGEKYKLSSEQINGLIMGIAASAAGVTIPGYYKKTIHEKVLHDMGYNRKILKRMQDIKGGIPPWYKALEIDPRNPEFDILHKVKAGLSVNEAWKALQRGISKKSESNQILYEEAKDAYKFLTAKKKIPEDYKVPEHPKGYEAPAGYLPTLVAAGELGYTKKTLDSLMTKLEDDTISDAEWKILHKITLRGEHWEKTVEESLEWLKVKRESESNTIPQGEFYHKDKGWY